jgi:mono/diheme cytochrome c family protein
MTGKELGLALSCLLLVACSDEDEDVASETGTLSEGKGVTEMELVARGQYLADNVSGCSDCHTPRGPTGALTLDQYLGGVDCWVRLEDGACLPTPNLTNHETGLSSRTDDEIKRMIRDGIRPTATGDEPLFPQMPYYALHNLTDRDLDSIVAYLRTVSGVDHAVPRRSPEFDPAQAATPLDLNALPLPPDGSAEREAALRGRYLAAEIGACIICHSPRDLASPSVLDDTSFFTGNEVFDVGLPALSRAGNITSDSETGIGDWALEDIVSVLKQGKDKAGKGICPPMLGLFAGMTDQDAHDVAAYIQSLAPLPGLEEDQCVLPPM